MILPVVEALVHQRFKEIKTKRECAVMSCVTMTMSESTTKLERTASVDSGLITIQCDLQSTSQLTEPSIQSPPERPCTASRNDNVKTIPSFINEDEYIREMKTTKQMQKMLILSIAFAAACGGMVTITGSSTNLVLVGQLSEYPGHGLNFASWFIVAFPISFLTMAFSWLWLTLYFCGVKGIQQMFERRSKSAKKSESELYIDDECHRLGHFKYEEGCTLFCFTLLVLLWMTRDIGGIGWGNFFQRDKRGNPCVTDSQAGLLVVCLCAMMPCLSWVNEQSTRQEQSSQNGDDDDEGAEKPRKSSRFLLTWSDINKTVPWDIMFLVGGGIAISEACKVHTHW